MLMAKSNKKTKRRQSSDETDGTYFLKLLMYLIIGSQWLRFVDAEMTRQIPIPAGLIIGVMFASHEHFNIDRKIEYAVLLVAMFVGFWSQMGIYVQIL